MNAYVLDDEPLAVDRLRRMLDESGRVITVGSSSTPARALDEIRTLRPDVLFLDIEMPGLSGFELLRRLDPQPLVVFTTAYPGYALDAFKVDSIDYLVKPVTTTDLARALAKLERVLGAATPRADVAALLQRMQAMLAESQRGGPDYLARVASRTGDRVEFVDVAEVTHFYAKDKLTFAVTAAKHHAIDPSIADLETRLPPQRWLRIHRATLLNIDAVKELYTWFGGKLIVRLKDGTELQVARDRAAAVRARLGI
jgi:two-component system, LytTR family, response regulator